MVSLGRRRGTGGDEQSGGSASSLSSRLDIGMAPTATAVLMAGRASLDERVGLRELMTTLAVR